MPTDFNELDKTIPIPLYYQLKSILLSKIQAGIYPVGEKLPTEIEFVEMLHVSRSTIRQAISELVQEGWLTRKTSKGTFVTAPETATSYIRSFEPFHQQISRLGKVPRTEMCELKIIVAGTALANAMGLKPEDKVISMFRRRFADDEPMVTIRNFLPSDICSFVISHNFNLESLYQVMTQFEASRPVHTKTIVSAEKATSDDVKQLLCKVGVPILTFQTTSYNSAGQIVDYAFSHYRGDLNKFEIDALPEK